MGFQAGLRGPVDKRKREDKIQKSTHTLRRTDIVIISDDLLPCVIMTHCLNLAAVTS
jgi:hypothetical protein